MLKILRLNWIFLYKLDTINNEQIKHHRETEILSNQKYLRLEACLCQNFSKEVLLTASNNQAKIQSYSEDCLQGGRAKKAWLRTIRYSMSAILDTNKFIFESEQ